MEAAREGTEVSTKPTRRKYTAAYKRRILEEADRCTEPGQVGALCRREGIYGSHLVRWRQELERDGLEPKKRGRKPKPVDERDVRIAALERELAATRRRADKAELLVEIQKKVSRLLGIELPKPPEDET